MSHRYKLTFGIRSGSGFRWTADDKRAFVANCLSDGDVIEWIKGTGIVHTHDPDKILDAMLDHDYSVTEGSVLRWVNVGLNDAA